RTERCRAVDRCDARVPRGRRRIHIQGDEDPGAVCMCIVDGRSRLRRIEIEAGKVASIRLATKTDVDRISTMVDRCAQGGQGAGGAYEIETAVGFGRGGLHSISMANPSLRDLRNIKAAQRRSPEEIGRAS